MLYIYSHNVSAPRQNECKQCHLHKIKHDYRLKLKVRSLTPIIMNSGYGWFVSMSSTSAGYKQDKTASRSLLQRQCLIHCWRYKRPGTHWNKENDQHWQVLLSVSAVVIGRLKAEKCDRDVSNCDEGRSRNIKRNIRQNTEQYWDVWM